MLGATRHVAIADEFGRTCNLGTTRTMANDGLLGSYSRDRSLQVVAPVATPAGSPALVKASNLDGTVVSSGVENRMADVDNVSTTATTGGDSDTNYEVEGQGRQGTHCLKSLEARGSAFKGLTYNEQLRKLMTDDKALMS